MNEAQLSPRQTAGFFEATNAEYHAGPGVSHSTLDMFLDSPERYAAIRVHKSLPPPAPTPDLVFGSESHEVMLHPDGPGAGVMLIPPDVLAKNGARSTNAYREFAEANSGYTLVKQRDYESHRMMVRAAMEHFRAHALLHDADTDRERNYRWEDEETGLLLKARFDLLGPTICDYKTARSAHPKEFARAAANYGYHRQAAFYQDAAEQLLDEKPPFVFLVVEKPFDRVGGDIVRVPRCEVIELSEEFVEIGRQQNRAALRQLAECHESGRWRRGAYNGAAWDDIVTVDPPQYLRFDAANWISE